MRAGKRTRVALGIFRDSYGYGVICSIGGRAKEKRFPPDTPLKVMQRYRLGMARRALEVRNATKSSFTRAAVRFLRGRHGLASFKSDRSHMRPWIHRFAGKGLWIVDQADVRTAISEWRADEYSAREVRHRVRILEQLYVAQGPDLPNPCAGVRLPAIAKPRPVSVSSDTIADVARALAEHERTGVVHDAKIRARYLVLATTGQRPAQMMRAQPEDVDLDRRIWFVRPAKGGAGSTVYLNDEMVLAWRLFVAAGAWGVYDTSDFAKALRHCGWPKGVRPYALRHSVGLALSELGADLGDIQSHMGHTSPQTTRSFYVPELPSRMKAVSHKLEGRLRLVGNP